MDNELTAKSTDKYEIFAFSYWYYLVFLLLYIPPIILYFVYSDSVSLAMGETGAAIGFLAIMLLPYFIAGYVANRLTRRPVRVSFDDWQITMEYFSRNLEHVKKTESCQLKYIESFNDYNLTSNSFRLKLMNGDTFSLHPSGHQKKDSDYERLVKDFKQHVHTLNPHNAKGAVKYDDFLSSFWGKALYQLCLVAVWGSVPLFIYVIFIRDPFEWGLLKLPVGLLFGGLAYISKYLKWDDEE